MKQEKIKYISDLAKIELNSEEIESISEEMDGIIRMMDKLSAVDTEGVQPTSYLLPEHDPLREDRAGGSLDNEDAVRNAPDSENGFFSVPAVIKS
ncbi:MAG: Asp-tRNA(Asn)/Glu-tRNA(Gln) amidotransferase subunit GatC [Chitinivibrionales bacterium]